MISRYALVQGCWLRRWVWRGIACGSWSCPPYGCRYHLHNISTHTPIGELKLNAKVGNKTCQTCQVAARAGCTLHQIATALFRSDPEKPSVIEGTSRGEAGDGIRWTMVATLWHLSAPGIILNCLASAQAISKGDKKWGNGLGMMVG